MTRLPRSELPRSELPRSEPPPSKLSPSGLPASLAIAFWLVASLWLVALVAYVLDAPREIIHAAFILGLLGGVAEWLAIRGTRQ